MNITLETKSDNYALLHLNVNKDDYMPEFNEKLKEYGKKTSIKGFRPGKVPPALIKQLYGKSIKTEVFQETLNKKLEEYIKENDVSFLIEPIKKGEALDEEKIWAKEDFEIELEGCIEPKELGFEINKDIKAPKYKVEISKEDLDEHLEEIKVKHSTWEDAEDIQDEDSIFTKASGEGIDEVKDLYLNQKDFTEKTWKSVKDKKKGEEFTINTEKDLKNAEGLGKRLNLENIPKELNLTIDKIQRNVKAELNQETFDKHLGEGIAKNLEEFKSIVKEDLEKYYERMSSFKLNNDLQDQLVEMVTTSFPKDLIVKLIQDSSKEKLDDEQTQKSLENQIKALKWRLITKRVGKDANIKLEHEDINKSAVDIVKNRFMQMGYSSLPDEYIEQMAANLMADTKNNKELINSAVDAAYMEKVFEAIKERISFEDKKVSLKEFREKL